MPRPEIASKTMTKRKNKKIKYTFSYNKLTGSALFLLIISVYLFTLAPTIGFRDSGDMVTASYLLGISHPSGFPLYMLTGKAFSFIPVSEIAVRYNLLSALFGALSVMLVFFSVKSFAKSASAALIVSAVLAFSGTFWVYSSFAEKYSLYAFFAALLIWFAVNFKDKYLPLIIFTLGLALTHHLAIIAVFIPMLYLMSVAGKKCNNPVRWLILTLLFFLPLCLYFYLPLRASSTPLNWGTPDTLKKIIDHISANDYRYAMFTASPVSIFEKLYLHLVKNYINEFTLAGFMLLVLGFWRLYKEKLQLGIFLLGVIAVNTFLFVNYNIVDPQNIATYYFSSFVSAAVVMGVGLKWLFDFTGRYKKYMVAGFSVFALSFLPANYTKVDLKNYTADFDFGTNILKTVEKGSVVIVDGDLPIFSLWYNEYAFGYDRNIEIIAGNRLELSSFIKENFGKKKIYLDYFPLESVEWKEYEVIPFGMMFRPEKRGLHSVYDKVKTDALWCSYRGLSRSGLDKSSPGYEREKMTFDHYAWALTAQGEFYAKNGFNSDALEMFEKALKIYPQYMEARIGIAKIAEKNKRVYQAKEYYDSVLSLNGCATGKNLIDSKSRVAEYLRLKSIAYQAGGRKDKAAYFLAKKNALENN